MSSFTPGGMQHGVLNREIRRFLTKVVRALSHAAAFTHLAPYKPAHGAHSSLCHKAPNPEATKMPSGERLTRAVHPEGNTGDVLGLGSHGNRG